MINIEKLLESKRVEVTFKDVEVNKEFVKEFRQNHHLTQVALANVLGVTKKTIEKWEQGTNKVGGSSAVLLKLLSENPELLSQLYHVKVGVTGKPTNNDYKAVSTKVISTQATNKPFSISKLPLVAVI